MYLRYIALHYFIQTSNTLLEYLLFTEKNNPIL